MATAKPERLGKYEIIDVLGKGAMGVVYEGRDPKLNLTVAIKTILTGQLDDDVAKDYSARFMREAQAVARLNHPNIVQVFDYGEENNVAYIVMEFIRGKELKSYFDTNQTFSLPDTVRIMGELLDALDTAHKMRIIHRDIKPANVMLDEQGRVKLTDFGVARISDADRTASERTTAGMTVGTPAYMSPGQITGERVDHRSDFVSAGIVLYQFLTGEKPFTGAGAWTIAKKIMSEDPRMPSEINVKVPREFDNVVRRVLAKAPDQRYANARDFAEALRQALNKDQVAVQQSLARATFDPDATVARQPNDDESGARAAPERSGTDVRTINDAELEFWRSIKDSAEAEDFDLYIQQFPKGIYADLARSKVRRLQRGAGAESNGLQVRQNLEAEARQAAQREADERRQHEADAQRELEARIRKEAEAKVQREAAERARNQLAELERAKREAAEQQRREAEAKAKREADEKSEREAAERVRLEALERTQRETAERTRLEAAERTRRAAAQSAKREAEVLVRKEAAAKAKLSNTENRPRAPAAAEIREPSPVAAAAPSSKATSKLSLPLLIGAVVCAAVVGAGWFALRPTPSAPAASSPSPAAANDDNAKTQPPDGPPRIKRESVDATAPPGPQPQAEATTDTKAPTEVSNTAKAVDATPSAEPATTTARAPKTTAPPSVSSRTTARKPATTAPMEPYSAGRPMAAPPLAAPPVAAYQATRAPIAAPPIGVPLDTAPQAATGQGNQKRPAPPPTSFNPNF